MPLTRISSFGQEEENVTLVRSGKDANSVYATQGRGGNFGGGAGQYAGSGNGAVRIVWGNGRAFPATDVGPS